jgi:hypothetical protein
MALVFGLVGLEVVHQAQRVLGDLGRGKTLAAQRLSSTSRSSQLRQVFHPSHPVLIRLLTCEAVLAEASYLPQSRGRPT